MLHVNCSSILRSYFISTINNTLFIALALLISFSAAHARGQASQVYPATPGEPLSATFHVTVDDKNSPVYIAKAGTPIPPAMVNEQLANAHFTSYDVDGAAWITVTYSEAIRQVRILPSSKGINYSISNNKVTFRTVGTGQLTVEINGDWQNSLHLFANSFETNVPSPNDPNVIYYAPGIHHLNHTVNVRSGQTVYLAEGAVLYADSSVTGPLFSLFGSHITFRGRGIIDGSQVPWHTNSLLYIWGGDNVQVEGITLRDSSSWTFHMLSSQNMQVNNIKVFGWRLNADGLDIDSSQNVNVSGSFFRTYDDLVVVKTNNTEGIIANNILVTDCVMWNQVAHAFAVGSEVHALIENVTFTNSDIIHDKGRDQLLAVVNGDDAWVVNVLFSGLRIEEVQNLIGLDILDFEYSTTRDRGHITGTRFVDITAPTPERSGPYVALDGYGSDNLITSTSLQNVTVDGKQLGSGQVSANKFVMATDVSE
jgi:hypothetical protein